MRLVRQCRSVNLQRQLTAGHTGKRRHIAAGRKLFQLPWRRCNLQAVLSSNGETIMSKSQDSKKAVKKEPAKSPKEKKEAKKLKKEASKRQ